VNSFIHRRIRSVLLAAMAAACAGATLPPAERILPRDAIAFVSVPNASRAREEWSRQPPAQLWSDPAMQPFREGFETRARASLLDPLTALTGLNWAALLRLADGQVTFALVPADPTAEGPAPAASAPALLLILDAGGNAGRLGEFLDAAWRSELAPPALRTNRVIDGVTCRFILQPTASIDAWLDAAFPRPADTQRPPAGGGMTQFCFAHLGEVFVASTSANALAAVISRIQPDPRRMVDPLPLPLPHQVARGSLCYGFLNPPAVLQRWRARLDPRSNPQLSMPLRRTLDALGMDAVQTAFLSVRAQPQGWFINLDIDVPARHRRGLLKLLELIPAPVTPPPFIPSGVLSFTRLRLAGPALWTSLQAVLRDIDPGLHGFVQLLAGYAGKTENADFDFEKQVIGLLGDDWLLAGFAADSGTETEHVLWVGSPQADQLAANLRLVASPTYLATFVPPAAPAPVREQWEVHGRPVVTIAFPALPFRSGATGAVHFASHAGGVAFSSSPARIESFLAPNSGGTPLSDRPDFKSAIAAVEGAAGGYLDYRNERESLRILFAGVDEQPSLLGEHLRWAAASETATRVVSAIARWTDTHRLPSFDQIERHLGIRVRCASLTPRGFTLTVFRPAPRPP
jgi:hypothetical protein